MTQVYRKIFFKIRYYSIGRLQLTKRKRVVSELFRYKQKDQKHPEVKKITFGFAGFFGSKSNSVVLVKSPMGSASAFPFLCY